MQLCVDGSSNLIWVWGIRICRDISDSSPLVAVICVLKMAANYASRALLVMRKHDGWSFQINFAGQKGVIMFKNMNCLRKILTIILSYFIDFYADLRQPLSRN